MDPSAPARDRGLTAWGLAVFAAGVAMILASAGVIPFEPRSGEAPLWVLTLAGSAFALAGLGVALIGVGHGSPSTGALPPGAPPWMRAAQAVLGLAAGTAVAVIGSWVAFSPGERAFSMGGLVSGPLNQMLGRALFGLGAVITWLWLGLAAVQVLRRLRTGR